MVLKCIRAEPRWDSQLDSRADYYAQLMPTVGISIDKIVDLVAAGEAESFEVDPGAAAGWATRSMERSSAQSLDCSLDCFVSQVAVSGGS